MVQQLDAYDFTSRFELGGDVDVALRRFNAAAGMIVGDDDSRSSVGKCIREDFAWMHGAAVNQANRDHADVQNLVRTVDAGAEEMLLLAIGVVADRVATSQRVFRSSRLLV